MTLKSALAVVIPVVLAAGAYIWYMRANPPLNTDLLRQEFTWVFVDRGIARESGAPTTEVSVKIAGVEKKLGIYVGNCFAVAGSGWELLPNEVSGAICYWAGGGKEIGIFEEGGTLVIKEGEIEEGSAEEPGFRGNFVLKEV